MFLVLSSFNKTLNRVSCRPLCWWLVYIVIPPWCRKQISVVVNFATSHLCTFHIPKQYCPFSAETFDSTLFLKQLLHKIYPMLSLACTPKSASLDDRVQHGWRDGQWNTPHTMINTWISFALPLTTLPRDPPNKLSHFISHHGCLTDRIRENSEN